jgi:tetratricopeptide (TPR) repeat protein
MRNWAWLAAGSVLTSVPAAAGGDSAPKPILAAFASFCGSAASLAEAAEAPPPVLVEGLGYSGIAADTKNAEAQRWFDQGIRFVWAFDEAEGIRAFQRAQALDPECALCFWGEAWARSPTLNLRGRTEEFAAAKAAAAKAVSLAGKLPERDRLLVELMRVRTAGASAFDGKAYAAASAAAAARFPQDDVITLLAADAAMQETELEKLPKGTLPQRLLEGVLGRNPDHTGAIHFYIHLTDWLEDERLAEQHASRLGGLAPGSSHLVHMPSHTFYGVGRYKDAMKANLAAIGIDRDYEAKVRPPESAYRSGLNRHNTNFAIGSALMIGDAASALKAADYFRSLYAAKPDDVGGLFPRASIYYAYGVHGSLNDVMALPEPSEKTPLLRAMRHYARGEALIRAGDAAGARREAAAIARMRTADVPSPQAGRWGAPMLEIAQHVIEGRAALLEGHPKAAEKAFRRAMAKQRKARFSTDPPTWWYPVRRSVAAALISQRDYRGARNQLLASLADWPNDPVAYHLLAQAERALGRGDLADGYEARARNAWAGDFSRVTLALA